MTDLITTGLLQGLLLAFVAYGIMIPFRILNFPDLTAEGTYPLGGAICATLLLLGLSPLSCMVITCLAAGSIGLFTAFLSLRFKINTLLAGIIVSTMLYSINLRIMGKPNTALFHVSNLFGDHSVEGKMVLLIALLFILLLPFYIFLHTETGLKLRAVGLNEDFAVRQGIPTSLYTYLGLFLGNGLVGLGGSLMVQSQSYADIGMGVGIIIHALAALMLGESLLGKLTLGKQLFAPLIGALIYQQIQGLALFAGLAPTDIKLLTGLVLIGVIALQRKTLAPFSHS